MTTKSTHLPGTAHPRAEGLPVLRLGFRPFYLGGASSAVVLMLLWPAVYLGRLPVAAGLAPVLWHAHEMLFGFAVAVVVGFLLTAGKVWTGLQTPRGAMLGALFALWLGARVTALAAPYGLFALLDLVFLPVVAVVFTERVVRTRNWRNLPVVAVLWMLATANAVFHAGASGRLKLDPMSALQAALALLLVLETIIAGRVIPAFTSNAVPGLRIWTSRALERAVILCTVAGLALWIFGAPATMSGSVLALAATLHAWRLASWAPWKTFGRPILFVLHASYAWIPVGLGLLSAALLLQTSVSPAVHAFGVGATGGLILAMITRTARGHTGRPLQASRREVAAYMCLAAAALIRVVAGLRPGDTYFWWLTAAGLLWVAAFTLYLSVFSLWLLRTRIDGRDG